jgi:hypothetical protein
MDTSSQTLFLMHIMDGYSFRNTIGIIKGETEYATMIVSRKSIEISFVNTSKRAVHKIILYPQEFMMFRYNIRDQDDEIIEQYPIAFETNEMFNTTKGIGRRDGIRLYWLAGDNRLSVQPIKMSTKDPGRAGALFVKILTKEYARYDTGNYKREPNVRVQAKDFADLCSQANTLKCTSLEIIGHINAVTFKGILANQTMASINRFVSQTDLSSDDPSVYNIDEIDNLINNLHINETHISKSSTSGLSLNIVKSEDLMTVKVPIATVKALSKIHNISPSGTQIRFYFAEGNPTKIESPIGTYGLYTICLRDGRN